MSRLVAMAMLLAGLGQLAPSSTSMLVSVLAVVIVVALVRRGATFS